MGNDIFGGREFDIRDVGRYADMAKELQAGRMQWVPRTFMNIAELMGLEGGSFLFKLPDSSGEDLHLHIGHRWYSGGKPVGPPEWLPGPWKDYALHVSCWLIDLAIMTNWFAEGASREAMCFTRCIPLDFSGGVIHVSYRLDPPEGMKPGDDASFRLVVNPAAEVKAETDVHLACWGEWASAASGCHDLVETIEKSHLACVFLARVE